MSEAEKFSRWRNVGYAEVEYCYVGKQALMDLLSGRRKKVSIYILGESERGFV